MSVSIPVLTVYDSSGNLIAIPAIQGPTGAKILSTVYSGTDSSGGNIYTQTFDNDVTATFIAPRGPQGAAGGFGIPTASIDGGVGTPSVNITTSGPDIAKVFSFSFHNLKGETGPQGILGILGIQGETGPQGTPFSKGTIAPTSLNTDTLFFVYEA